MKKSNNTESISLVLIPGAWSDESVWDPLKTELQKFKYSIHTLTLSGLKDIKKPETIDLKRHVEDLIKFIKNLNSKNIVLVGHSYSGFVATLAANEISENILGLIFIEAILPKDGYSFLDMSGLDIKEERDSIKNHNGMWQPPTKKELKSQSLLSHKQIQYLSRNLKNHPGKTVLDNAVMKKSSIKEIPTFFIGSNLSDKVKYDKNFKKLNFIKIDGGHWPMLTKTEELAKIIDRILKEEI